MIQPYSLAYNVHLFYKIKHAKNLLNKQGEMVFKPDMFVDLNGDSIASEELTFNPKYLEEIVETSSIRPLLQRFINEKNIANVLKQVAADVVFFEAVGIDD
jgi:hypothetical protein